MFSHLNQLVNSALLAPPLPTIPSNIASPTHAVCHELNSPVCITSCRAAILASPSDLCLKKISLGEDPCVELLPLHGNKCGPQTVLRSRGVVTFHGRHASFRRTAEVPSTTYILFRFRGVDGV